MENGECKMERERDGRVRRKGEDLEDRLVGFAARIAPDFEGLSGLTRNWNVTPVGLP